MNMKTLAACAAVSVLGACATPTNEFECLFQPGRVLELAHCSGNQAGKIKAIQVHNDMASLPGSCERISAVTGFAEGTVSQPTQAAQDAARERVAELGGDTPLITAIDQTSRTMKSTTTVRGTAMRCRQTQ